MRKQLPGGLLTVLCLFAQTALILAQAEPPQPSNKTGGVVLPVMLNGVEVYMAPGEDSAAARAEAARVEHILAELRKYAGQPDRISLRERGGAGIILLDTAEALAVRLENRVHPELSPLANALALREQILAVAPPAGEVSAGEEELLLRILLGVVYPVMLLVILRMTRFGVRTWERNWRKAALEWMNRFAERRGLEDSGPQAKRLVNILSGIERFVLYGMVFIVISFGWFALFPQTQPLAKDFLAAIIAPVLRLIGGTAQAIILIVYSAAVIFFAYWLTRRLSRRRYRKKLPGILAEPMIYFLLRLGIGMMALFLILFPYPGVPRLIAIGVLLLTLLAVLLALRPLIEEIAAGVYVNGSYRLKSGDRLTVDGVPYVVESQGLVHLLVLKDKEKHWLPYSKILKADLGIDKK